MRFDDLRSFVSAPGQTGDLAEIEAEVDWDLELVQAS